MKTPAARPDKPRIIDNEISAGVKVEEVGAEEKGIGLIVVSRIIAIVGTVVKRIVRIDIDRSIGISAIGTRPVACSNRRLRSRVASRHPQNAY